MKTKTLELNLEKAREWYNGSNESLKELALQAYTIEELQPFRKIKTFEDACKVLNLDIPKIFTIYYNINTISKATAAMFVLNLVRKALHKFIKIEDSDNTSTDLIFIPLIFVIKVGPNIKAASKDRQDFYSKYYSIIGNMSINDCHYEIYGNSATSSKARDLHNIGNSFVLFDCATKEIAKHLSYYFGTYIAMAIYGGIIGKNVEITSI